MSVLTLDAEGHIFLAGSRYYSGTESGNPWHDPKTGKFSYAPPGATIFKGADLLRNVANTSRRQIDSIYRKHNGDAIAAIPGEGETIKVLVFSNGEHRATVISDTKRGEAQKQQQKSTQPQVVANPAGTKFREQNPRKKIINFNPDEIPTLAKDFYNKDGISELRVELVPLNELLEIREHIRTKETGNLSSEQWDDLKEKIAKEGFNEPVIIEYAPSSGRAYVGEGNHRLAIAKELGIKEVPARGWRRQEIEDWRNYFVLDKMGDGYVPANIAPSQMGLSGRKITEEDFQEPIFESLDSDPLENVIDDDLDETGIPSYRKLRFVARLGGSTGAELHEDDNGVKFVVKHGASPEHIRSEYIANKIYEAFDADLVPKVRLDTKEDGTLVQIAEFVEGKDLSNILESNTIDTLRNDFARLLPIDALIANWDVIGLEQDNVLVDSGGNAFRIDNGGALSFRAMGAPKQLTPFVDELFTMPANAQNEPWYNVDDNYHAFFSFRLGLENVVSHQQQILDAIPEDQPELSNLIKARIQYLDVFRSIASRNDGLAREPEDIYSDMKKVHRLMNLLDSDGDYEDIRIEAEAIYHSISFRDTHDVFNQKVGFGTFGYPIKHGEDYFNNTVFKFEQQENTEIAKSLIRSKAEIPTYEEEAHRNLEERLDSMLKSVGVDVTDFNKAHKNNIELSHVDPIAEVDLLAQGTKSELIANAFDSKFLENQGVNTKVSIKNIAPGSHEVEALFYGEDELPIGSFSYLLGGDRAHIRKAEFERGHSKNNEAFGEIIANHIQIWKRQNLKKVTAWEDENLKYLGFQNPYEGGVQIGSSLKAIELDDNSPSYQDFQKYLEAANLTNKLPIEYREADIDVSFGEEIEGEDIDILNSAARATSQLNTTYDDETTGRAVNSYATFNSGEINMADQDDYRVRALNRLVWEHGVPLHFNALLFRGTQTKFFGSDDDSFGSDFKKGDVVSSDWSFASTSLNKDKALTFGMGLQLRIHAPAGTKGIWVHGINDAHPDEVEFLLPQATTYRFMNNPREIRPGTWEVDVEIINLKDGLPDVPESIVGLPSNQEIEDEEEDDEGEENFPTLGQYTQEEMENWSQATFNDNYLDHMNNFPSSSNINWDDDWFNNMEQFYWAIENKMFEHPNYQPKYTPDKFPGDGYFLESEIKLLSEETLDNYLSNPEPFLTNPPVVKFKTYKWEKERRLKEARAMAGSFPQGPYSMDDFWYDAPPFPIDNEHNTISKDPDLTPTEKEAILAQLRWAKRFYAYRWEERYRYDEYFPDPFFPRDQLDDYSDSELIEEFRQWSLNTDSEDIDNIGKEGLAQLRWEASRRGLILPDFNEQEELEVIEKDEEELEEFEGRKRASEVFQVEERYDLKYANYTKNEIERSLARIDEVLELPDRVKDLPVKIMSISEFKAKGNDAGGGAFVHNQTGLPKRIEIENDPQFGTVEEIFAHEFGHFVDATLIDAPFTWASVEDETKELFNSIKNTPEYRGWSSVYQSISGTTEEFEDAVYLLKTRELFARAFSQYIATKTQDTVMKNAIKGEVPSDESPLGGQWSDESFAAILEQFDRLFERTGWLKSNK